MPTKDYEIPRYDALESRRFGWCLEALQEGEAWLGTQRPAQGWTRDLQMLSAPDGDAPSGGEQGSNVGYNKGKRVARELVASLANFRYAGEFVPTWDQQLYDKAHVLTQLDEHWSRTCFANESFRKGYQWGVGTGTSYFYETWDKHYHGPFKGDIRLDALAPQDVYLIQLPKDHDIQRAYAVVIREELPINLAKAIYEQTNPAFAASLTPDRDQPGWLTKGLQKLQRFVAPALRVAGRMGQNDNANASFPTVDIFHMYVMDRSINDGSSPRQMGVPGTNWSYTVPAIGDPVPTGIINPNTGNYFTEPATVEHARLFPLRRYVIFSRTALGYDSTSPWWHGQVPLSRLSYNDWAWEALGSSLVGETKTMQDGIVAIMRMIEDSIAARLNPSMVVDDSLAESWGDAVNPRLAGGRARAPLSQLAGDPMRPVLPVQHYNVEAWITNWVQEQEARIDYMTGVTDMVAIAKAKQVPGADTLEKLMEMAGPIVQDLIRRADKPLTQLGEWRKAYYMQFYTKNRVLRVTGPDGVDIDVQYRSEMLVGQPDPRETPAVRALRTRGYLDDFRYEITESGINEIHRMTTKLFYTQLMKAGFPISWWTFAKVAQIPNFGPPPVGTHTELERWVAQQHMMTEFELDKAQQAAVGAADRGLIAPGGPEGGGAPGDGGPPGQGGNGGQEGRPPSFNKPPHLETKDQGTRATIATS